MKTKPTIVLSYLYQKIRENHKGNLIKTKDLKEIISRCIISSPTRGGNTRGIPKVYIYELIEDMIDHGLIVRIDHKKYSINEAKNAAEKLEEAISNAKTIAKLKKEIKVAQEIVTDYDKGDFKLGKTNTKRLKSFPF